MKSQGIGRKFSTCILKLTSSRLIHPTKRNFGHVFFPSTVSDIGCPLPLNPYKTAYNPSFCSEEMLMLEMSDFLFYGDILTFFNLFDTEFSRLTCPATWHQTFSPK